MGTIILEKCESQIMHVTRKGISSIKRETMIIARERRGEESYVFWEEKKTIVGVEDSMLDLENAWIFSFLSL
jgi:hypothetical protein